jgi:programmed cell death protein 4
MIQIAARRSRQSRAKRQGGGGTAQQFGIDISRESTPVPVALDIHDPNYDSEDSDDEGIKLVSSYEAKSSFHELLPRAPNGRKNGNSMMHSSLSEFKTAVIKRIQELFVSEDVEDFAANVVDLKTPSLNFEVVRRLLTVAIERNARECELASRALARLSEEEILSVDDVAKGFERVFELADDLALDTPQAKDYIGRFLARAVADECLPPSFLTDRFIETLGGAIVQHAKSLLSIRHGAARLSRVWGPTALVHSDDDDESYLNALKGEIKTLLTEYLSSGDIDEAVVCVKRLDAPHYHHELVKRAVVLALDGKQRQRAMMSTLICELHNRGLLSSVQVTLGFRRLVEELPDLELDTPGAAKVLQIFFDQAVRDGLVDRADLPKMSSSSSAS